MTTDNNTPLSLARTLRIAGYCMLGGVALALFVAMCAILHEGELDREAARGVITNDALEQQGPITGASPDVVPVASAKRPG